MSEKPKALVLADELDAYHTAAHHKLAAIELRCQHYELRSLHAENERLREALHGVDEFCQQGLNSAEPVHWEAALHDIMGLVRAALRQEV